MLQEWALFYMLRPLTKDVYSLYVFSAVGHFVPEKSLLIGGLDTTNQ